MAITTQGLRTGWLVYTVHMRAIEPNRAIYVGLCRVKDFAHMPDAWEYDLWRAQVNETFDLDIAIVGIYPTESEAFPLRENTIIVTDAIVNKDGRRSPEKRKVTFRGKMIRDCETGEMYEGTQDVANTLGVSRQSVSMHLNGFIKVLRGKTFEYAGFGG